MRSGQSVPTTIDEYIAGFPPEVADATGQDPDSDPQGGTGCRGEDFLPGSDVYIEGQPGSLRRLHEARRVYPGASGITNFQAELAAYDSAKGSVQFPFDKPLPVRLIAAIVKFRVKENLERAQAKARKVARAK